MKTTTQPKALDLKKHRGNLLATRFTITIPESTRCSGQLAGKWLPSVQSLGRPVVLDIGTLLIFYDYYLCDPPYLCYWPSESSHTLWLICCPPTYTIPFPVLVTCGFLVSGSYFLFVLWLYTGGLSSWNLLLFMCLCNHRHFKIISVQFHEIFPFLATRTLILLWVIAIKFLFAWLKLRLWVLSCVAPQYCGSKLID